MDGSTRVDDTPVHQALREALANCLVNADYYGRQGLVIIKKRDAKENREFAEFLDWPIPMLINRHATAEVGNIAVRRNFAQVLRAGKVDPQKEYSKLYSLFYNKDSRDGKSLADLISMNFKGFDFRGTCLTLDEFDEEHGFNFAEQPQDFDIDYLVSFCEYTNNAVPQKCIVRSTGLKRNTDIFNYQVSHIWGLTKNVFLFESPWNICYAPKIMDPFTGHETKGTWPQEYQQLFLSKALDLYRPFIDDYNNLIMNLDVAAKIGRYVQEKRGIIPDKDLLQFEKDAINEFQLL